MNEFEVLEKLGQGSYGTVYKVRDRLSADVVVLKQIPVQD